MRLRLLQSSSQHPAAILPFTYEGSSEFAHARTQILSRELRPSFCLLSGSYWEPSYNSHRASMAVFPSGIASQCGIPQHIYYSVSVQYPCGWHTQKRTRTHTDGCGRNLNQPFFPTPIQLSTLNARQQKFKWPKYLFLTTVAIKCVHLQENIISATNITVV